jgi:hypothetical protein
MWCLTLSCWYSQVQQCRTQLQQQALVCMICHMHYVYIFLTLCVAPHREHGCRGSPTFASLKCETRPLMRSWEFNSLFTYLGGGSTLMARKFSVIHFISFVSSNWVVINHQKGGDCKCHRALMWVLVLMTKDGNGSGLDQVESPCTQNQNPNPNQKSIRVEIHHQNQTRRYPKPERILKTQMDTRNP